MVSIATCIVMLLVAAAPLAFADTHYVVKGEQGPRANAISWDYIPTAIGSWWGHIVNDGLRSLVVDVYDTTTGAMDQAMHERFRFASLGAFPNGEVNTSKVVMSPNHKYTVVVMPNGPMGATCTVEDVFKPAIPPVAMFTWYKGGSGYLTVSVNASSNGNTGSYDPDGWIVSYDWSFGDGSVATGVSTTHTYADAGYHTITLTVTDNDGITDTTHVTVETGYRPVASFTYTLYNVVEVTVDASSSYDPDGQIVIYSWEFGDGWTASGPTSTHSYATKGTFPILLTVTDNDGLTDSTQQIVQIGDLPVASFTYTKHILEVTVDGSSSYDPDGYIAAYDWMFGDGGTGSGMIATHKYPYIDQYEWYWIRLTVTDNDGQQGMSWQQVGVCDFDPGASFTCVTDGYTVSVDASGSWDDSAIVSYAWNWGDGTLGTDITATHTYATAGIYAITLTVTDDIGQTGDTKRYVHAPPEPVASFVYTVSGSTVYVDASGSSGYGGIVSYTWDWGDGSSPEVMTSPTASHTYSLYAPAPTVIQSTTGRQLWTLFGYVYLPDGVTPAVGATVTVTNLRSGYSETMITYDGYYATGLIEDPGGPPDSGGPWQGDAINVTAVLGTMIGWSEGVVDYNQFYLWLDVTLSGPGHAITLTVTDTLGRTSTLVQWVPI